jgi:lysophospholipase L1-like esterase
MNRLSRVTALPLAPVLFVQARRTRRRIPSLPDTPLPWSGTLDGPRPLRLLVLGDSTAAGVGTDTQHDALPGNFARALQKRFGRGIEWAAAGANGATSRDILARFIDEVTAQPRDLIFLTIGANDALGLRSRDAFARDLVSIVRRLRQASPDALLLFSAVPCFDRFYTLKNPLRWSLARHSASLNEGARSALAGFDSVFTLPTPPPYSSSFWASDLFHPGASGYREWTDFVFDTVPTRLLGKLA